MEVLELIGTEEAREWLAKLCEGAPEARLTQEADDTCERLVKRFSKSVP